MCDYVENVEDHLNLEKEILEAIVSMRPIENAELAWAFSGMDFQASKVQNSRRSPVVAGWRVKLAENVGVLWGTDPEKPPEGYLTRTILRVLL